MKPQPKKEKPMSKRVLMTVGIWAMVGLLVPLFIGCGGGGTGTDVSAVTGAGGGGTPGGGTPTPTPTAPTFTFATPTFSPASGGAGLVVTLTATAATGTSTNLNSVTAVTFAGAGDTFVLAHPSSTTLTVKVPQGARNGLLSLKGGANTAASTSLLSFATEPTVTGFTPNIVRAGAPTTVTIFGTNLCAATGVAVNSGTVAAFDQTAECSGSSTTQTANTKLTVTLTPSRPVTTVTVTTTNGSGANAASAYAVSGSASTNTRIGTLQSFSPTTTGGVVLASMGPINPGTMVQAGNLIVYGMTNALLSMNLGGTSLGSVVAGAGGTPFTMATVTSGGLTSVYLTSFYGGLVSNTVASAWDVGFSALASRIGASALSTPPVPGPIAATPATAGGNGMIYIGDTSLGSLFSAVPGGPVSLMTPLVSSGGIAGMGFGLNSVWVVTSLGSVQVVENASGATSGPVRIFAPFTASRPSQVAFSLTSVWVAGGDAIGILSSTGAAWPTALLASFNLNTGSFAASSGALTSGSTSLTSWGAASPLVSVLAYDAANIWYLDVGQQALVRCAAANCATGLTSFAFTGVGARVPTALVQARTLLVDSLGSIWFDGPDAVERLIP